MEYINIGSSYVNHALNTKYGAGLLMLIVNVGTSLLMQDLIPVFAKIFSNFWIKRLLFFFIFFSATRDALVSLILTIITVCIVDFALNEKSTFCIIPNQFRTIIPKQTENIAHKSAANQMLDELGHVIQSYKNMFHTHKTETSKEILHGNTPKFEEPEPKIVRSNNKL